MRKAPTDLAGLRVLVVEDEYFLAADLVADLRRSGVEVVGPAGDLEGALAFARDAALDAAVLDLNLRGESALPVADVLVGRGGADRLHHRLRAGVASRPLQHHSALPEAV